MKMKKQYGVIFATLFLCIAMHAQDFQPMEYNGLLYQELACNVADRSGLHPRLSRQEGPSGSMSCLASVIAMPVTMHSPQSGSSGYFP